MVKPRGPARARSSATLPALPVTKVKERDGDARPATASTEPPEALSADPRPGFPGFRGFRGLVWAGVIGIAHAPGSLKAGAEPRPGPGLRRTLPGKRRRAAPHGDRRPRGPLRRCGG